MNLLEWYMKRTSFGLRVSVSKKKKLIADGTILCVAHLSRARTQRVKRFSGKSFWVKRRRKVYSQHYRQEVEFEEVFYSLLVMVLCDEDGAVYDLLYHPASYHEVRSFGIRQKKSAWFRYLLEHFEFMEGKAYRGCEGVRVCKSKEERVLRQAVESVNAQITLFSLISRRRRRITMWAYLLG